MKTGSSKRVQSLFLLCLVVCTVRPRAAAQTAVGLDIQLYAGLTVTGAIGTVYSVEYVTDLAETNIANAWRCLEYLQLPASPYLWADKSAPATGRRFYRAVVFAAPTNLVFIPPGTFRMGSPTDEVNREVFEAPQTEVTISRGFWMGRTEVTQMEYGNVLTIAGYGIATCFPSHFGGPNRPVEQVSWNDATNYCGLLTQQQRAGGQIPINCVCRLPTEAEWEYACRAWTSTRFSYGDDPGYTNLTSYAWYEWRIAVTTHPVGEKLPNPSRLYDMHGNVEEWCQDWWVDHLPGGSVLDPQGPGASEWGRVIRSGSWMSAPGFCRSAFRGVRDPNGKNDDIGFRVVLAPGQP